MINLQKQIFENFPNMAAGTNYQMVISVDKDVFRLYTLCVGLLMGKTIVAMSLAKVRARSAQKVGNFLVY